MISGCTLLLNVVPPGKPAPTLRASQPRRSGQSSPDADQQGQDRCIGTSESSREVSKQDKLISYLLQFTILSKLIAALIFCPLQTQEQRKLVKVPSPMEKKHGKSVVAGSGGGKKNVDMTKPEVVIIYEVLGLWVSWTRATMARRRTDLFTAAMAAKAGQWRMLAGWSIHAIR